MFVYYKTPSYESVNYPKYNHFVFEDGTEVLEFAVAGFLKDELSVEMKDNVLYIAGKQSKNRKNVFFPENVNLTDYRKNISERSFNVYFTLADYSEVKEVAYQNGLLSIQIVKNLPDAKKPKKFNIS